MQIVTLRTEHIPKLREFCDRVLGEDYFSEESLADSIERSTRDGVCTSLGLQDDSGEFFGIRLTYLPGNWSHGKGNGLSPHLWKTKLEDTAYFQSLFIDPSLRGQGWGPKLSLEAIEMLKKMSCKAIACHSWMESPNNSSNRYLLKLGFKSVAVHKNYWKDVEYTCTRCGRPCLCTAEEMILYL